MCIRDSAYDAFVRDYIPKEGDFREFIKKYIEEYVQEDDKERITEDVYKRQVLL